VAGWANAAEIHALSSEAHKQGDRRAPGSPEMLELSAAALYAKRVIAENNRTLSRVAPPVRFWLELRWAWLVEGAARWFSGQTNHARAAVAQRLREPPRPAFPPTLRDAPLLGGTVIDLLAREEGELAAAQLASRLRPHGPRAAFSKAFRGRPLVQTEGAWRVHLARFAGFR
jgi:hypothetical protein